MLPKEKGLVDGIVEDLHMLCKKVEVETAYDIKAQICKQKPVLVILLEGKRVYLLQIILIKLERDRLE